MKVMVTVLTISSLLTYFNCFIFGRITLTVFIFGSGIIVDIGFTVSSFGLLETNGEVEWVSTGGTESGLVVSVRLCS